MEKNHLYRAGVTVIAFLLCFFTNAQTLVPDSNGIIYVTENGAGNGSTWASATSDLHNAIHAGGVEKVFVAIGEYRVGDNSFVMKNGVEIYGGFDPENNILDLGDERILPNRGISEGSVLNGENTRPVIWNDNNGLNNTAVLDGFTIKRGYISSDGGGGIHNKSVSPVFNNLVVRDNSAKEGAGMWNSSSSPVMTNVVFQNNIATAGPGGAMYNMISSTATITNAVFKGNESTQFAGGVMYNFTSSSATLTNVLIVENVATSVAAIVQSVNGNLTLNNVSIFNNNIAQALYVSSNGTATINNSIIFGSVDAGSGGTFSSQDSFVQGNTNTANGNVNTSGLTATDIFTNPSASDYSLKHSSVINKGNNTLFSGLAANTKDLAGNLRLVGAKIDLGAYEYQASIIPDANGIIYVRPTAQGNGDGSSWNDATNDLHNAIHLNGVQKVFVAVGTYPVGSSSFIMKNGVEIYGGFDPANNIKTLSDNRILPTESTAGSVLNGENTRPLIWNNDNGLNNTAILDGFTLTNGSGTSGGAIFNVNVAPVFNNLVIKNNTASVSGGAIYNVNSPIKLNNTTITNNTAQYGGGVRNNGSNSEFTNIIIKNNTATLATAGAGGGGIFNENSALKLTNVLIANNSTNFQGGGFRNLSGNPVFTNVTIANNTAVNQTATAAMDIAGGNPQINNSIIFGTVSGSYTPQYSMIEGNANFSNGNIATVGITDVFTNPSGGNYTLKLGSYVVNTGSNSLFTGLDANTKDLAGNARVYNYANSGKIDMGAYESTYTPITPTSGIVYVTPNGTGNGNSWANATSDLHTAIQTNGVQKVFVAKGNYNVGDNSFVMKNGVAIYGGFDPANGITDLTHNRIMPNAANTNGSILNGEGARPVIWNVFTSGTAMTGTAVLDGFTVINGSYSNGAGIRNVYASPTLRNLVIRGNNATSTGAGIYNENSNPDIYNTVISGNMIISAFNQSGMGAGIYNGTNAVPTIVNTTIANNTITGIGASPVMVGAGVANLGGANPKIYNSIIWNNQKNGVANTAGADIENSNASITLENSITQSYNTGNTGDNNKVGSNPLFVSAADYRLQGFSPAFNAGSNALFTGLDANTKDLAGNPRLGGSSIDMGAYEYTLLPDNNGIIYVRNGFEGKGTSWADATGDLHNAIHAANVQKVFVASGNYNVGDHSFIMKNNVEIYGGFDPANGITDLSHNRIMPNAANTQGSVLNGQNVRPVVWNEYSEQNPLYSTAVLDGFTVMNGRNDELKGAGIYNFGASPTLRNLVLRNNVMTSLGAALYNVGSNTVVTNVSIINNTGRGVVNSQSTPQFTNVLISGNTGAGVYNWGNNYVHIDTYTNVTIANNGLPFEAGAYSHFKNSILWDDINGYDYGGENNLIKGNVSTANGNLNTSLMVPADIFTDYANGDYTLKIGSPAINVGNNALFTGLDADTKDLAGNPRVHNFANGGVIDMGAYESTYNTQLAPDANGIIYVTQDGSGNKNGKDWDNAASDLHNAIHTDGVTKVFVAVGEYNVGDHSFIMKNNVEIYGGFDPANNIKTLNDDRILPNRGTAEGSVLNGQNVRPVIWNVFDSGTALNTSAVLDGFTVMNGLGDVDGGGIRNVYASPTLRNLVVKNNSCSSTGSTMGGGIYNKNFSSPVITNVIIKGNTGRLGGGYASFDSSCEPVLTNVLVVDNIGTDGTQYGGIFEYGKAKYTNVTVAGNSGKQFRVNHSSTQLNNVIVLGENANGITSLINVHNSLIQYNTSTNNGNLDATGITAEDIFTNPSVGDYTLKEGSPAVNTGSNAWFTGLDADTKDLAGNARVYNFANGGVIDMGAYESTYNTPLAPDANGIIYVTQDGTGNKSGKDWNNATKDLHNAIHTDGVTKVFAAIGNYNVGSSSFIMKNNVEIYGGFDPANNIKTLADNRILPTENVGGSVLNGENAKPVIWNDNNGLTNTAVLDGFTITNGNGSQGGGIHNYFSSPTMSNLVIKNNHASVVGGGIYSNFSDNPVINNVIVTQNTATYLGGGIYLSIAPAPVVNNLTVTENTSDDGGGMYINYSTLTLEKGIISNNTGTRGGGIHNLGSTTVFNNVKMTGNIGVTGGAIYSTNSDLQLTNVEITSNISANAGAAIYHDYDYNKLFTNTTIAGNSPNPIKLYEEESPTILYNSIIYGSITGDYTAEYSLIEDNTDFTNGNLDATDITEEDIFTNPSAGDYTLKSNSPVVDMGNNALFTDLDENTIDLAGNPRLYNGIIDLGAYESQSDCSSSTTWDGANWSNGIPDIETKAVIDGDLILDSDLEACELLITSNGNLEIPEGYTFVVNGTITNNSSVENFVVANGGNLIQNEDVENSGSITVLRQSSPMLRLDYTLWSSPVIGQNLFNFSPETINGVTNYPGSTGRIYIYDGANGYINPSPFNETSVMNSGTGYLFRSPNNFDNAIPAVYNGTFIGTPFNGSLSVATIANNYTSVGNPYPSNIDANEFITANPEISTLYFWNNNHNTGNNYSACVLNNCVAAAGGGVIPNGIITIGQGFIIATSGTSVNLDNTMRTDDVGVFSKMDETEKHRFWLNLNDDEGNGYNQILVGYMDGATNGIDNQIDGKLFNYEGSALYNLVNDGKFVIQGRALPFDISDVVPLGFRAAENGKFKIELANFDGVFAGGQKIYLKDYSMNLIHDLTLSDYTFESVQGEFKNRFEIIYKEDETMGIDDLSPNQIRIYTNNEWVIIESGAEKILSVELFDLQGRLIHQNQKVNDFRYKIKALSKGVLVVKAQTQDGKVVTKKVINK